MTGFEFATAGRIVFGTGRLEELGGLCRPLGCLPLVVTGRHSERAAGVLDQLGKAGLASRVFPVDSEPTIELVDAAAEQIRTDRRDLIVACGGGSAIDAGKAMAALATNPGSALDYLEVVGGGKPLTQPPLPFVAIPTTAGAGAEVTRNAVLLSRRHGVKASLRSPMLLAGLALVDPQLTVSLPRGVTASTGLDALTQLIEPYVSRRANPMTDALCVEGMRRVARSLRRACDHGGDLSAREDMCLASLFGGVALANAGLGAVHGFAAPIGGQFAAPHGAICASLLPHAILVNIRVLRAQAPGHPALDRYTSVAQFLTGDPQATIEDGMAWLVNLCTYLEIPSLGTHGVAKRDISRLVELASRASSLKGNPIELEAEDLEEILIRAL